MPKKEKIIQAKKFLYKASDLIDEVEDEYVNGNLRDANFAVTEAIRKLKVVLLVIK